MLLEHLKEAQQIVDSIKSLDLSLRRALTTRQNQIFVRDGSSGETYVYLSREVAEKALEMQKVEWRTKRASLLRRANQIGLIL